MTIFVAILISSVAAFYSIVGLMAIFAASKLPIAIMGGVLEIGKLVVASWTFRNWKKSPILIRLYFVISIFVLMFITSLGIFGFLSKAHLEQSTPTKPLLSQIEQLDIEITQKTNEKNRFENALSKYDMAFDKYIELGAVTKGLNIRKENKEETELIQNEIRRLTDEINYLNIKSYNIKNELNMLEVEVGPIKYIANLIYDDVDNNKLEDSVRYIILLLIIVFDPLAVMLIIAGNISIKDELERRRQQKLRTNSITLVDENSNNRILTQDHILNIKDEKEIEPIPSESPVIETNGKRWIISQWKELGFKSPRAYISFLKKFT